MPQHSYINQEDNPNLRNFISLYISTGLTLTTEVYNGNIPITVFLEYALTELIGGGKLEWFEVTTDWQIKNRDSFPALETRNAIINILKKTNSWEKCRKRLSRNLLIKYTNIKNLNSKSSSNLAVRQSFLRFFKASIIAYKCFNDTRFLELFKGELLHTGKLSWLELDESGKTPKLVPNSECNVIDYYPHKDLVRLQSKFNQAEFNLAIDTLFIDLKRQKIIKLIEEKVEITDRKYNQLKQNLINPDIHFRKQVMECIQEWQDAYSNVKYDIFIDRVIKELIGKEGLLFWFELNDDANLINHRDCRQLGFEAGSNLNEALDKSINYYQNRDAIWKGIRYKAAEIIEQETNLKYEQY